MILREEKSLTCTTDSHSPHNVGSEKSTKASIGRRGAHTRHTKVKLPPFQRRFDNPPNLSIFHIPPRQPRVKITERSSIQASDASPIRQDGSFARTCAFSYAICCVACMIIDSITAVLADCAHNVFHSFQYMPSMKARTLKSRFMLFFPVELLWIFEFTIHNHGYRVAYFHGLDRLAGENPEPHGLEESIFFPNQIK